MMDLDEFKEKVKDNIKSYLPMQYEKANVSLQSVVKNNDVQLTGLMIRLEENNIAPFIYLDHYYEQYQNGMELPDIMKDIAELRVSSEQSVKLDISRITDFNQVKDNIICKLINGDMNEEYLADKPYTQIEDMAVIYVIDLGSGAEGHMSSPITYDLMKRYGVDTQMLHEIAIHNLAKSEIVFKSMKDALMEIMFPDGVPEEDPLAEILSSEDEIPMYVLSNAEKLNGAASVLDKDTMETISEMLGGDFVVIPSSIHEVIILPMDDNVDKDELEGIIREVNTGQVAPEERLSYHAYQYDSGKHALMRMDKKEELAIQQQQDNQQNNHMHTRRSR